MAARGQLHHLELWVGAARTDDGPWSWLLTRLGYERESTWASGASWRLGSAYVVLESGRDHERGRAERRRSGMNHVAFWAGTCDDVDVLTADAPAHGWTLLFPHAYPFAGGTGHYAAYLECAEGLEVELVADG
ncbi:VOC family protein [Pseudokineococcus sp. 1T1Z-3]|uniref:VOC family protein n=1 Tax=Pseudokineococcus sp. 1T1Z-3 TaxID=3132745 RepID=UPI0030B735CA